MKFSSQSIVISGSGGAILGGSLAGPVGAVIGAVAGATVGLLAGDDELGGRTRKKKTFTFHFQQRVERVAPAEKDHIREYAE